MGRSSLGPALILFLLALPRFAAAQDLDSAAALGALKAEMSYDPLTGRGIVERGELRIEYIEGSDMALFSDGSVAEVATPRHTASGLAFPTAFMDLAKGYFERLPDKRRFTIAAIILDPGHGGKDPGATADHGKGNSRIHVVEKDVNLQVSRLVFERLRKAFPEKKVLATRSSDVFPELSERTDMANSIPLAKNEAIIFVSIHTNASLSKKAKGFEVWYLDPDVRRPELGESTRTDSAANPDIHPILTDMLQEEFTTESIIIAKDILESLDDQVGRLTENRGIKSKDWYVVKNARMPAVLIELSYLTNEQDARLLADPAYLKKLADGIYNGLVSFIRYFDTSKGFTE